MQQEPGSEAAAAFHLHEQERTLIEQSMPEGQLREERLGQAQRRHDDVIDALHLEWTERAAEPAALRLLPATRNAEETEVAAFDMQLASLGEIEASALKELAESERAYALSSYEQMQQFHRFLCATQ